MRLRHWIATIANIKFPGGWETGRGSLSGPAGTLHLSCVLSEAGAHDGRSVTVRIAPDQLEMVGGMVARGIELRDQAARTETGR